MALDPLPLEDLHLGHEPETEPETEPKSEMQQLIQALNRLIEGFQLHEILRQEIYERSEKVIQAHTNWINQKMAEARNELVAFWKSERDWMTAQLEKAKGDSLYTRHVEAVEKVAGAVDRLADDATEGEEWKRKRKDF